MPKSRKDLLDALERRLVGPKRIALFGHRAVGKTTLLAMFYREASTGRVPDVRLGAGDPATAEYLAETIARIEAGEPPPGTLSEAELKLKLYHGRARFDLIVKDYQGEHVTLGTDEPIQRFFADCDAVLLCLDPAGSATPAEFRRRQQEVEDLLERYIATSDDATAGRPVAMLLTKFDQVAAADPGHSTAEAISRLVERRYGMTAHLLATHAPRSALFAVSSYGPGSIAGRPPTELHPMGLEGPLGWLAEELEAGDLERLDWIWDLAPDDLPRLTRCVAEHARRYPRSDRLESLRARLAGLRRRRNRRVLGRGLVAAAALAAALAGYDAYGYREATSFERRADSPAPAVARRWSDLLAWHPSLRVFWPDAARAARSKLDEWTLRAEAARLDAGADPRGLRDRLAEMKSERPEMATQVRAVEAKLGQAEHDAGWAAARASALADSDAPDAPLASLRDFLRAFPDTPRRGEADALIARLKSRAEENRAASERGLVDDLIRSAGLPGADLRDSIDGARRFLAEHPDSRWAGEVSGLLDGSVRALDARDIEKARGYSRDHRTNFAARIERYNDYLKAHANGGRHVSEANEAKDRVLREWDDHAYRQAYDHLAAHPDDVAEVARRLREYLQDHKAGRHARDAQAYCDWWDKASVPRPYRVVLKWGAFPAGTGQGLAIELEVAGVRHGPSPIIPGTSRPVWGYAFSRPVVWKSGDAVTVRVLRNTGWFSPDLKAVHIFKSPKGDPIALRLLSGEYKPPSPGNAITLSFDSDFAVPRLGRPD